MEIHMSSDFSTLERRWPRINDMGKEKEEAIAQQKQKQKLGLGLVRSKQSKEDSSLQNSHNKVFLYFPSAAFQWFCFSKPFILPYILGRTGWNISLLGWWSTPALYRMSSCFPEREWGRLRVVQTLPRAPSMKPRTTPHSLLGNQLFPSSCQLCKTTQNSSPL